MFPLVPAYPGCPGSKAVKRSLLLLFLSTQRTALLGLVVRLGESTLAHMVVRFHVDASLGQLPDRSWHRRPGRPCIKWSDQLGYTH